MFLVACSVAVVLLNAPLIIIGTRGYAVLNLFLVGNLLTCCAIIPLIFGLIPALKHFVTETAFILGIIGGILGVTGTGIGISWIPGDVATSFSAGADWAWYSNNYDWRPFLAALLCSLAVTLLWSLGAWLLYRVCGVRGPGISGVLMAIPGMKYVTATPYWGADNMDDRSDAKLKVWDTAADGPKVIGSV